MIDTKEWKHNGLVQMDIKVIQTPIKQLMFCMPNEKTSEEQEFYNALEVINKYINE